MVFPLFDDNSDRQRLPFVTWTLIGINAFVFVFLQGMGDERNRFTREFSLVPKEIVTGKDVETDDREFKNELTGQVFTVPGLLPTPGSVYLTFLTSIFMHGSWAHLLGNMLFLWIFGDNVEDYLGYVRYTVFYLVCGVIASLSHVASTYLFDMDPEVPSLGASGAISGVLGAYLLLYPERRVTVLLFRFLTQVPAWVAIGMWFLFQLIESIGMFGGQSGGVAYGAHIGGFIAGLALVRVFGIGVEPPRTRYRRY